MILCGVFYNYLYIELYVCIGYVYLLGDFINIKVYKNKLIN